MSTTSTGRPLVVMVRDRLVTSSKDVLVFTHVPHELLIEIFAAASFAIVTPRSLRRRTLELSSIVELSATFELSFALVTPASFICRTLDDTCSVELSTSYATPILPLLSTVMILVDAGKAAGNVSA